MNKLIGIVIAAVVIIGGIYFLMNRTSNTSNVSLKTAEQNQSTVGEGRVVFSVTDATVNMSTISEINMKVNRVDVHSQASGWLTVSATPQTYSLLKLNAENKSELLADISAKADTYDQVRLIVDSVSIKTKAGVTSEAKLPSGELKINTTLVVKADTTSSVNFDFLADKSLHVTGNGKYIFAPVVKTETKSEAEVNIDANSVVTITRGKVESTNTMGMDIDGSVKLNFQIKNDIKLDIDNSNAIKVLLK